MAISSGVRLGPYEILAPIGAGGMGEVYRARDTRLDRDVAIKILPPLFSRDPDRLARFEREAKTLASLNHPHIAQLHGVEESPSAGAREGIVRALVMEYVDGDTLSARLANGPLPMEEALAIARQIAEGLSSAHESGIIHRDLKPSNIKINDDGVVKVLDFGLAMAILSDAPFAASTGDSPTFTTPLYTQMGVILGTAAYMSPEQARGRQVDRRADIWAFGCVLYEMLSGRPAFAEATVTDTLAAIVTREPDWNALPSATPQTVRWVLRQCLERDPKHRLRDIADAAIALEDVSKTIGTRPTPLVIVQRRGLPMWATAAVVVATALVVGMVKFPEAGPPSGDRPVRQFRIPAPYLRADARHRPVISPNGRAIAWAASGSLWLYELALGTTRTIAKDVQPTYLTWSPNSDEIMFVSGRQLLKVSTTSPGFVQVAEMKFRRGLNTPGGAWLSESQYVFASAATGTGIETVAPFGGSSFATMLGPPAGVKDFHSPHSLPNGGFLVVIDRQDEGTDRIGVIKDGQVHEVFQAAGERLEAPVYSPSGHLIYDRQRGNRGLWFVAFSLNDLTTSGAPVPINGKAAWPSVSRDGTLVYTEGDAGSTFELATFTTAKEVSPQRIGEPLLSMSYPRLSPDGKKIVVVGRDEVGTRDLYIIDVETGVRTRITRAEDAVSPRWAPGNRVLYVNHGGRSPEGQVRVVVADGIGHPRTLVEHAYDPTLSPDNQWLIFNRPAGPSNGSDVYRIRVNSATMTVPSGEKQQLLLNGSYNERIGFVHRSGAFLAYEAEPNGDRDLFLTTYPVASDSWQVSRNGVDYSMWHPTEDKLLYVQGGRIFEVPVTLRPGVAIGEPREVFDERSTRIVLDNFAEINPNGREFVGVQRPPTGEAPLGVIVVVENWFELFRGSRPR